MFLNFQNNSPLMRCRHCQLPSRFFVFISLFFDRTNLYKLAIKYS
jgi:hypothetical protein